MAKYLLRSNIFNKRLNLLGILFGIEFPFYIELGTSKLGVVALTKILARSNPEIVTTVCCPGYCATDMSSHGGPRSAKKVCRLSIQYMLILLYSIVLYSIV